MAPHSRAGAAFHVQFNSNFLLLRAQGWYRVRGGMRRRRRAR
jgi:hypothetical protein